MITFAIKHPYQNNDRKKFVNCFENSKPESSPPFGKSFKHTHRMLCSQGALMCECAFMQVPKKKKTSGVIFHLLEQEKNPKSCFFSILECHFLSVRISQKK
jgi:hypothetical protein